MIAKAVRTDIMKDTTSRHAPAQILYLANSGRIGGGNRMMLAALDSLNRTAYEPVVVLPDHGEMADALGRRRLEYGVVALDRASRKIWPVPFMRRVTRLVRWIRRFHVRLVHANGPEVYMAAGVAARLTGVPTICHFQFPPDPQTVRTSFVAAPCVVVCCSEIMRQTYAPLLGDISRAIETIAIPNMVDVTRFAPGVRPSPVRAALGVSDSSPVVTIIGHISEVKGHTFFLQMAQRVVSRFPDATFLIVGDDIHSGGVYRVAMTEFARTLGVLERVRFLGFVENVPEVLQATDVLVLPSLAEGLPLTIVEAMGCSVPVVATAVDGNGEAVEEGITGFLIPPADVDALTTRVLQLLEDADLRESMGRAGRQRGLTHFSLATFSERLHALYARLASQN